MAEYLRHKVTGIIYTMHPVLKDADDIEVIEIDEADMDVFKPAKEKKRGRKPREIPEQAVDEEGVPGSLFVPGEEEGADGDE